LHTRKTDKCFMNTGIFSAMFLHSFIELKKVMEIFTRMFHDPHSKVFAVFVDTFIVFVHAHSCDLVDWFSVSFHRLLNKAGSDVLGSLQGKITKALDALRFVILINLTSFQVVQIRLFV